MRIEPLLLWSLNAALPDGGVGIDRPDRISCRLTTDNASSGACVPEGFVVWLGRYVVPERHESLEALCGRYKCTAGVNVFFVCCVSCFSHEETADCQVALQPCGTIRHQRDLYG